MGGKTPRGEMTEQERLAARRHAKQAEYLASIGQPIKIPSAPATEHLRDLDARGMTAPMMAAQAGLSVTTCRDLIRGRRPDRHGQQSKPLGDIYRDTVERALSVRFVEPAPEGIEMGKRLDGTGTARRIQAMMANGFSLRVTGDLLDMSEQRTWQIAVQTEHTVLTRTAQTVAAMYSKYQHVDPADYGLTPYAIARAAGAAGRRGYAPSRCWDDDTIDDPQAHPEWTGACGTEEGYRIHIRETVFEHRRLPLCTPCREAVETRAARTAPPVFLREKFSELVDETGMSLRAFATKRYGDASMRDTLYRWRDGTRTPRTMGDVERLAHHLDVDPDVLVDREAMAVEASRPVVGHGKFNPYVLRVALDLAGMSLNAACLIPGANYTTGALSKWTRGEMTPMGPEKLQPIADYFGIDVKEFYA